MKRTWTGFITHAFASWPEARRRGLALGGVLLSISAVACAPAKSEFGIRLSELRAERTAGGLEIHARQDVQLSGEARTALRHGVPLRLRIDLTVSGPGRWSAAEGDSFAYEIRYLPLSDHYQLSGPTAEGPARTFPRLRHVLAALEDVDLQLSGIVTQPGAIKVRMRSRLDRSGMPGPMQLPVLLSPHWAHDSGWISREFEVGG